MSEDESIPREIADAPLVNGDIEADLKQYFAGAKLLAIHFEKGLLATWSGGVA